MKKLIVSALLFSSLLSPIWAEQKTVGEAAIYSARKSKSGEYIGYVVAGVITAAAITGLVLLSSHNKHHHHSHHHH